ncbi:hypothetical protein, partial [Thermincola ferriacetica]|uniref:hypothetical protein n=1 Tax=Thermincola ferriacetica TaxID=281456 RepID=UPI001A9A2CC0
QFQALTVVNTGLPPSTKSQLITLMCSGFLISCRVNAVVKPQNSIFAIFGHAGTPCLPGSGFAGAVAPKR